MFKSPSPEAESNILNIRIQPTEGVYLQFNIKRPGETEEIIQAKMDFCQSCSVEHHLNTPEAYERLIGACFKGERSWFFPVGSGGVKLEICGCIEGCVPTKTDSPSFPMNRDAADRRKRNSSLRGMDICGLISRRYFR